MCSLNITLPCNLRVFLPSCGLLHAGYEPIKSTKQVAHKTEATAPRDWTLWSLHPSTSDEQSRYVSENTKSSGPTILMIPKVFGSPDKISEVKSMEEGIQQSPSQTHLYERGIDKVIDAFPAEWSTTARSSPPCAVKPAIAANASDSDKQGWQATRKLLNPNARGPHGPFGATHRLNNSNTATCQSSQQCFLRTLDVVVSSSLADI